MATRFKFHEHSLNDLGITLLDFSGERVLLTNIGFSPLSYFLGNDKLY